MDLVQLQIEFTQKLLGRCAIDTGSGSLVPECNLSIYRNTIWSAHIRAIIATYPLIFKLIGEACFRAIAKAYATEHPSMSGNLYDYGDHFSDFIDTHDAVKHILYLPEVAQFEWLCHQLNYADVEKPTYRLKRFRYPILKIIDLCEGKTHETIHLRDGGVNLKIERYNHQLILRALSNFEYEDLKHQLC